MKKIRVAINGAGRIGRAFYKAASKRPEIEIVAMNDLADINNIVYLLKYDSVYGQSGLDIKVADHLATSHLATRSPSKLSDLVAKALIIDGKEVVYLSEKDPANLPWKDLNIDVVVESTGLFASFEKSKPHLAAGAKRVVITAPVKEDASAGAPTILMSINEDEFKDSKITSNASCTTNSASPLLAILDETIGIEKAILTTVHGYTASQSIVDGPNKKDWKEGRAGGINIVPTSTGSAIATTKALKQLSGKFDGISMRVPVPAGSIADITFISRRPTSVEEVNSILKSAAKEPRWQKLFTVIEDPIVSTDIIGSTHAAIADLGLTRVIDGNLVKVLSWYDNEMGYTYSLVEHVIKAGEYL
jgi:glyceraldehyde 3-phosphate dehydrogenase